jgi:glutamate synthase (NADPH/NADH) large chain
LDEEIYKKIQNSFEKENTIVGDFKIENTHRAVGTKLSHYIYKKFCDKKIEKDSIVINLSGSAGQSLGAFGIKGLKLNLTGEANDYVGKGLSGATVVIKPPKESNLISNENTIIGNTVLYGATSGKLFAAGQSGERFAVRNSGAEAVIEGCDSNGCEYMTGGTVVILGKVGDNFAAGMTGGMAFVYDPNNEFENYVNPSSVIWLTPETDYWKKCLLDLVRDHFKETESAVAKKILESFDEEIKKIKQVCPKEMIDKLTNPLSLKKDFLKAI